MKCAFLILLLWSFMPGIVLGQEYNYTRYTTKDGLAGETVYTITQDRDGFLWLATETGLSRFDGRNFKTFTTADGLPSNEVFGCYEDDYNRIWLKTFGNEICYYKDGRIYNRSNDTLLRRLSFSKEIDKIVGTTRKEVIMYDLLHHVFVLDSNNRLHEYKEGQYKIDYRLLKENMWVGTHVLALPADLEALLSRRSLTGMLSIAYKLSEGRILFSNWLNTTSDMHILIWDIQARKEILFDTLGLFLTQQDAQKLLGFRPTLGAAQYDLLQRKYEYSFLPEYKVNDMNKDSEGNLWFSTRDGGLFKLGRLRVMNYPLSSPGRSISVRTLYKEDGSIIAGTNNDGLWRITKSKKGNDNGMPLYRKEKLPTRLSKLLRHRGLYVSYAGANFLEADVALMSIKSIHVRGDSLLLAMASQTSLCWENAQGRKMLRKIYNDRSTCAFGQGGYYYIGTLYGLLILDSTNKVIGKPLNHRVSYFAASPDGSVWVGTYDHGIYLLKDNRVVDSITRQNCAISSNICHCVATKGKDVWIGTDKGLDKLTRTDSGYRAVARYTTADGLSSDIINALLIEDSTIYVGTSEGLNMFSEGPALPQPRLHLKLTGVSVDGREADWNTAPVLANGDNIRFEFSAISQSEKEISYQYRLLGVNDEWQSVTEPVLSFLSLPSGKYHLQIRALGLSGSQSEIVERHFEVVKAFYEHWWFYAIVAGALAALVALLVQQRLGKIRRVAAERNSIDRKVAGLEQMALRAQMNPHFIFNCLNSIQNYILKNDVVGANFYLSQFGGLVRQTLDNAPRLYITLAEEINFLRHYIELEKLQRSPDFDYVLDAGTDIRTADTLFPNMILQPFVENAIKHGLSEKNRKGQLDIHFALTAPGILQCVIRDNGPGINAAQAKRRHEHQPKGTDLTRKRVETLNMLGNEIKQISVVVTDLGDTGASGTQVVVTCYYNR